jgi:hypothetical protein
MAGVRNLMSTCGPDNRIILEVAKEKGNFLQLNVGPTVTTAWRVLGLRIEDTAYRYGG